MCKEQVWKAKVEAKLPSLNEYINACRTNRYAGAEMKRQAQTEIGYFINRFPRFEKPVKIRFTWLEGNKRRDLDNVCFAKKFILDAMVECGKLQDDNRKNVTGFTDTFQYGDEWGVIIEVEEVEP